VASAILVYARGDQGLSAARRLLRCPGRQRKAPKPPLIAQANMAMLLGSLRSGEEIHP
jgi:hypothetical protein